MNRTVKDIVSELCASRGLTLKGLERDLKFGNGVSNKWDTSYPSAEKLMAVADYFNVSVDYLLGREQPKCTTLAKNVAYLFDRASERDKKIVIEILSAYKKDTQIGLMA